MTLDSKELENKIQWMSTTTLQQTRIEGYRAIGLTARYSNLLFPTMCSGKNPLVEATVAISKPLVARFQGVEVIITDPAIMLYILSCLENLYVEQIKEEWIAGKILEEAYTSFAFAREIVERSDRLIKDMRLPPVPIPKNLDKLLDKIPDDDEPKMGM